MTASLQIRYRRKFSESERVRVRYGYWPAHGNTLLEHSSSLHPRLVTLARYLASRGIHYGWVIAAATFLTMLATAGAVGAPGVLIGPLKSEFGWDTADISAAFAVRLALYGLMGPIAAAVLNRFGICRVAIVALTLIGGAILCSFMMTRLWHLLLFWGIVVGFGTGLTAMVLGATVATRWFSKRRGLVIGLLTASTATGQLVFLPLLASLTEAFGWRTGLGFILAVLFLSAATVLVLMRDHPSDIGLWPYGADSAPSDHVSTGTLRAMLAVIDIFDFFDFVGTVGSGWLSDRFYSRWLLFWYYGLRGLSLIWLTTTSFDFYALGIFAVVYGLDWVATVPPTVKLRVARFGERSIWCSDGSLPVISLVLQPLPMGQVSSVRTLALTYLPAFFFAGGSVLSPHFLSLQFVNAPAPPGPSTT